ncbi:hypothetical protein MKK75_01910 [Methylobacterium sp. J-030]|uniref:hypothetical protein n=1 Tax=Methylobacterium sp. J-030 TaxID=2836627 RepID=UPI001FB878A0|nr:hypothetical protein [Methylobacterium sp. J-030]MCJ2067568.1 hypothetical protein [Methylobacterium sp. J-030]
MSNRSISWNAALRDIRSDRTVVPVGFLSARARCQGFAEFRHRPLVVAGQFDRSAVMAAAASAAKAHQERHGGTWQAAMSVCLKASWQAARMARNATAH